jgi:cytochrome c
MRNLVTCLALALAACSGADREADVKSIIATNCGSCHVVPGVPGAIGNVGPPLTRIGNRQVIAGYFANNRQNMVRWVSHAQSMLPNNAMPDTNLSPEDANRVADYLSRLR